jgi:hypothetical protein
MIKKRIYYLVIVVCLLALSGCSGLQQLRFEKDKSLPITLGQIVTKEGLLKNNIETKGVPKGFEKARVSFVQKELTGAALTSYRKQLDTNDMPSEEGMSLESVFYYEIELVDDIGFAQSVNNDRVLKSYVSQSKKAAVVTLIKCMLRNPILAEGGDVYLEIGEHNTYELVVYNQDQIPERLKFNDLTVFDYQVSYFCYGKDHRNQIAVMDLVEEGKHCKRPLERKTKNLLSTKKLVDY